VLATDIDGQSTLSAPSTLLVDGVPPAVRITRTGGGAAVSVLVTDAYSGVEKRAVSVSFGDGGNARGRARFAHRFSHAGVYRVTVRVRDKLGVQGIVSQWVSVR
jgi:hypothetical protein